MILFVIIDRTGRKIRLTQKQWSHICEHPEMTGEQEHIKETLEIPDTMIISPRDTKVHYYTQKPRKLLTSVMEMNGQEFLSSGFLVSQKSGINESAVQTPAFMLGVGTFPDFY